MPSGDARYLRPKLRLTRGTETVPVSMRLSSQIRVFAPVACQMTRLVGRCP